MAVENMRYYKGTKGESENISIDIMTGRGGYITTCAINVQLLTAGVRTFPCGNGDDFKLSPEIYLETLEFLQEQRKEITDRYPVKTYEGWKESGLPTFEDYCSPGDEVDEAVVDHFVNSVPPVLLRSSCTQAGEAYNCEPDERTGRHRDTYTTFHRAGEGRWIFDGYCFYGENENRVTGPSRLQQLIDEVKREVPK